MPRGRIALARMAVCCARSPASATRSGCSEKGLPRFHPSFRFEESLAEQLRRAADRKAGLHGDDAAESMGQVVSIAVIPRTDPVPRVPDRRLLMGGAALASGLSIAGAVLAWRRAAHLMPIKLPFGGRRQ